MDLTETLVRQQIRQRVLAFARENNVKVENLPEESLEAVMVINAVLHARQAIKHGFRIYRGNQ